MLEALVIADDLTGAADTGLAFHGAGFAAEIRIHDVRSGRALANAADDTSSVLALSTETRHATWAEARRVVSEVGSHIARLIHDADGSTPDVLKKIDSTLRGHVGAEVEALLDALPDHIAWIVPSYPRQGRSMRDGVYTVRGRPLAETEFAAEVPDCPSDSRIAALFAGKSGRQAAFLSGDALAVSTEAAAAMLRALYATGSRTVVFDAVTDEDIERIVMAGRISGPPILWVGSAGLASSLARRAAGGRSRAAAAVVSTPGAIIVAAGSRNPVTARQVEHLLRHGGRDIVQRVVQPNDHAPLSLDPATAHVLLTLPPVDAAMTLADALTAAARLGAHAARAAVRHGGDCARLILTGGDIAVAACRSLGVEALEVLGAVEEGIPLLRLRGGALDGALAVTKAGGFGTEESLYNAYKLLAGNQQ